MISRLPQILAESVPGAKEYTDSPWFLPVKGSQFASESDMTLIVETFIIFFFTILVYGLTAYFCIKYRRREGDPTPPHITHHNALEIAWTIAPTIIVFIMFYVGASGYLKVMGKAPKDARIVNVYAMQWSWEFRQPGTKIETTHKSNVLYLEKDKPVQLRMISKDVLHSFYIPGMRTKMDVVPARYTTLNIVPIREGEYNLYCTEYCGKDHSRMITKAVVLNSVDYRKAVVASDQMNPYEIYKAKCFSCHSIDGATYSAPTWKGLFGTKRQVKNVNGVEEVVADEQYITDSIRKPAKDIVLPYAQAMSVVYDEKAISDNELEALIAWMKLGKFEQDKYYDIDTKTFISKEAFDEKQKQKEDK